MPSRLALIACTKSMDGPWLIARGNESKLEIFGLGHGDVVRLELLVDGSPDILMFSQAGTHSWPNARASRFRVCKSAGDQPAPTTVRILLNGKRENGNT